MNPCYTVSKRWTLLGAALFFAAGAAGAGSTDNPVWYSGGGYVEPLDAAGPGGRVAFGRFNPDDYIDLVQWGGAADKTVYLHDRFAEYDDRTVIAQQLDAFAVTRSSSHRIWGIKGGALREFVYSSQAPWPMTTGIAVVGSNAWLRAEERPTGSLLFVIDTAGTRLRVFSVGASAPSLMVERYATTAEGHYHDALYVDWDDNGTDQLAFVCDLGGKILLESGSSLLLQAVPAGAFLDVLPAEGTQWGRDLLFFHYRATASAPATLLVVNSVHTEFINAEPFDLDHLCWADFSVSPRRELILPLGGTRRAVVRSQKTTATAGEAVFWIDPSPEAVNAIGLTQGEGTDDLPLGAPPTAVADLDDDGDEDVLFADDRSLAFVVTPEWHQPKVVHGDESAMPMILQEDPLLHPGVWTFFYDRDIVVPTGTDRVEVEIWYQPDLVSPLDPVPHIETLYAPFDCFIDYQVPAPVGQGVYQMLFRAVDVQSDGVPAVEVRLWSHNPTVLVDMTEASPWFYPWKATGTDAGGTVERPHIGPGEGTGGH